MRSQKLHVQVIRKLVWVIGNCLKMCLTGVILSTVTSGYHRNHKTNKFLINLSVGVFFTVLDTLINFNNNKYINNNFFS